MGEIYLHNEMKDILEQNGQTLEMQQITQKVNERKLYKKRDGSEILRNQISARVRKYPRMFSVEDGRISLAKQ